MALCAYCRMEIELYDGGTIDCPEIRAGSVRHHGTRERRA